MYDIKICKVTFVNLRVVSKLSTMVDRLVRNVPSQRGKVNLEDSNQFRYCNNGEGKFTTRWQCSNLGEHGLQSLFHQSPSFQEIINKLYALSYVKVNDVVAVYREHVLPNIQQGLDENVDWQDYLEELHEFGEYYESTWIERRNHRSPKYPPVLWNHHDSIMQDGIQTNNYLESYNRTLNSLAGKNANVWIMQDLFVKQDADSRRTFLSNSAGQDRSNDTGKKHKSLDKRARIQFILNGYDAMPKNDLITMLAHSI